MFLCLCHICTSCTIFIINKYKLLFLFRYNSNHVLHRLLPQPINTGYNLRQRTHDLTLPTDISAVIKQNFIYRMLFRDIYKLSFQVPVLFRLHFLLLCRCLLYNQFYFFLHFILRRMCVCHMFNKVLTFLVTYLIIQYKT